MLDDLKRYEDIEESDSPLLSTIVLVREKMENSSA
jgi:hypothetical protein